MPGQRRGVFGVIVPGKSETAGQRGASGVVSGLRWVVVVRGVGASLRVIRATGAEARSGSKVYGTTQIVPCYKDSEEQFRSSEN
jgi:hypothetical protein